MGLGRLCQAGASLKLDLAFRGKKSRVQRSDDSTAGLPLGGGTVPDPPVTGGDVFTH